MRRAHTLLLAVLTVLSVACNGGQQSAPREWGPLSLGRDSTCPVVAGRYFDTSQPIAVLLAANHLPRAVSGDWAWFELTGVADSALAVTVAYRDGAEQSGRLRRGSPYEGDYYCEDGWLKIADKKISDQFDDETESATYRPRRRAMRVAKSADGALVARFDYVNYSEVTVWCGDGCKGIPVPGTFTTHSVWSAAEKWDPDLPTPSAVSRVQERDRRAADLRRAQRDKLYQEEQRLENGPELPGQADVDTRARAALVPGMLLRGLSSKGTGWNLSMEFAEPFQLEQFIQRLSQSGVVAELREEPAYRVQTTNGRWTGVVYVRYEP